MAGGKDHTTAIYRQYEDQLDTSDVAVVIVSYNTRSHLHSCLNSVLPQRPGEVVVVDNASTDGSAAMVAREFTSVRLYANTTNRGFGAAANQGVRASNAPYVLLLNSDTRLCPLTLLGLQRYLEAHSRAAIVGPRLISPDGRLQRSCFPYPSPLNALLETSRIAEPLAAIPVLRERYLRTSRHQQPRVVPWIMGAAIAIRRSAFEEVGGFDESFFMYQEETDLCYRLAKKGWQTHFTPIATVVHIGGASAASCRAEMARQSLLARVAFYQRHYSKRWQAELRLILGSAMIAKLARDRLRLRLPGPRSSRQGLSENLSVWRQVLSHLTAETAFPTSSPDI